MKFLVNKQFAQDSQVFNEGKIVELDSVDAKALVDQGLISEYVEEKKVVVEFDQKGIADAVREGLASLAPVEKKVEVKGYGFGQFLQGIAKKTINITTAAQGEAATTILTDSNIKSDLIKDSGFVNLSAKVALSGTNNQFKTNMLASLGTNPATTAESGTISPSQPLLDIVTIDLVKTTYLYKVTEEALEDTGSLVSAVNGAVVRFYQNVIEDGILNGGSGFVGITAHAETVAVAAESGQTTAVILPANLSKMFVSADSPQDSVWIFSRSAYTQLLDMEDGNSNRIFQPSLVPSVAGTLFGLPVYISNYANAVGFAGDVTLADMSYYQFCSKGALRVDRSDEIYFLTDESAYRFAKRMGGDVIGVKKTVADGTETGHFVQIADRIS